MTMAMAATRLGPLRVRGVRLQVGVVEGGRRQRPVRGVVRLVAHVRSPIQKQTSISTPDADEQADEAFADRADPAQARTRRG